MYTIRNVNARVLKRVFFILAVGVPGLMTMLCCITTAHGTEWTSVGPKGGVGVTSLAIDPRTPSTVYIGANEGGVYKTNDGGVSWSFNRVGMNGSAIHNIAIDPITPSTTYAAAWNEGIFKTVDGGMSWTAANGSSSYTCLPYTSRIVIDPATPSTLYAGGICGVYKSIDGGINWIQTNNGLTTHRIYSMAIDSQNPSTLYVGTDGGGVFKSTDRGANWTAMNAGLTGLALVVNAFALDRLNISILYISTLDGIFKSTDRGDHWTRLSSAPSSNSLAIDPHSTSTIYAAAGSIYKSIDGGATWAPKSNNVGATVLALDPMTPSIIFAGADDYGIIDNGGAYKSADGGHHWTGMNLRTHVPITSLVFDTRPPHADLYAGSLSKWVYGYDLDYEGWRTVFFTNSDIRALVVDYCRTSNLYAGTFGGGVFRQWQDSPLNNGLWGWGATFIGALVKDPSKPGTLYAGTSGGGVYKTTNQGANWIAMNRGFPSYPGSGGAIFIYALAVEPKRPWRLYAGTGAGVYVFNKYAMSGSRRSPRWEIRRKGFPYGTQLLALAVDPNTTPTTIYAGTAGKGIYKNEQKGTGWKATNTGLTNLYVQALAIDTSTKESTIYLSAYGPYSGSPGKGVFKSENRGGTWMAMNAGLEDRAVNVLAIDPYVPKTLYAGTDRGIYRYGTEGALSKPWLRRTLDKPRIYVSDPDCRDNDLSLYFANVVQGSSIEAIITIINGSRTENLVIGTIASANPLAVPFSKLQDYCSGTTLEVNDQCTLTVRFAPTTTGRFSDSFDIPSNDPEKPVVTMSLSMQSITR